MNQRLKLILLKFISKLRKKFLGSYATGVIYETKNGLIAAPIEDLTIGRHLGFKGNWDMSEITQLLSIIEKKDVVYFIGTHIGTLLIPIAKNCKNVIGYEANPDNYKYLNWNIQANTINNVSAFNYAIGDKKRIISFYQSKVNSGGSKIKPEKDNFLYNYDNPNIIEVDMISLDTHIELEKLPYPDCIIMDIEGSEYFALKGMQETLEKARLLYVEYVPHHLKNVSNVSNENFINLIIPYFNSVKFMGANKEIKIDSSSKELIEFLDELFMNNISDDLLFIKKTL